MQSFTQKLSRLNNMLDICWMLRLNINKPLLISCDATCSILVTGAVKIVMWRLFVQIHVCPLHTDGQYMGQPITHCDPRMHEKRDYDG